MASQALRHALLPALLLLAGCATVAPPPTPAPEPTDELSLAVQWVARSAEYRAITHQAFNVATRRLEELAAGRVAGTWAVGIDADETILDNLRYQIELERGGERFDLASWHAWVRRQEAGAIPGAIPFLRRVHELGGRIVVVTNRLEEVQEHTEANLRRAGIPFDLVLSLPPGVDGSKEPRWQAVAAGTAAPGVPPLEVLLWVGDNIRDFPGLDQGLRLAPDEAFAAFGDRYFVLPNPLYGSWAE